MSMKTFINLSIFVIVVLAALCISVMTATANEMNKGSTTEGNYYKIFDAPELTLVSTVSINGTKVSPQWTGAVLINSQINAKEADIEFISRG